MFQMTNVTKAYRTDLLETHALREFSLSVDKGEFVAVTGPSGSGKTTFLNVAGLLESFDSGTYRLDGEDVSKLDDDARSRVRNHTIGFIFQSFNLIPDLNVFDNVDVPLCYRRMPAAERRERARNRDRRWPGRWRPGRDLRHRRLQECAASAARGLMHRAQEEGHPCSR